MKARTQEDMLGLVGRLLSFAERTGEGLAARKRRQMHAALEEWAGPSATQAATLSLFDEARDALGMREDCGPVALDKMEAHLARAAGQRVLEERLRRAELARAYQETDSANG